MFNTSYLTPDQTETQINKIKKGIHDAEIALGILRFNTDRDTQRLDDLFAIDAIRHELNKIS